MDLGELLQLDMEGAEIGFGPQDEPSQQEMQRRLFATMREQWPAGLCASKEDHVEHPVLNGSLAPFWCTADQNQREPWRSEQRRKRGE